MKESEEPSKELQSPAYSPSPHESRRRSQRISRRRFWFEVDPVALGEEELPVFAMALQRLRDKVLMAHPPHDTGKKAKRRKRRRNRRVEKRNSGLRKTAAELEMISRARVPICVFNEASKAFAFGSASTDAVLGCGEDVPGSPEALCRETEEKRAEVKAEANRMAAVGDKVVELQRQTGKRFWWDVDQAALLEEELPVFVKGLQRLRDNVRGAPPPR